MEHLKSYSLEIAERLKSLKGVIGYQNEKGEKQIRTLVDGNAIFITFMIENLEVLQKIDKTIPPHYYFSAKGKKVIIQYHITKELSEFIAHKYLFNEKILK
ncbi:hypothetical protein ACI75Y_03040 [Capnocytophaga stomatis]|uniref:hypothetical protein n=1 Tax=Capnocytophaga stomatis TaxID=1848904 RepID=UPI003858D667